MQNSTVRKQLNWEKKKAGDLTTYFTDRDILTSYKQMKRCPTLKTKTHNKTTSILFSTCRIAR